jgi:hypothetical protein
VDAYVVRFQYATLANVITFGDSEMTSLAELCEGFWGQVRAQKFPLGSAAACPKPAIALRGEMFTRKSTSSQQIGVATSPTG